MDALAFNQELEGIFNEVNISEEVKTSLVDKLVDLFLDLSIDEWHEGWDEGWESGHTDGSREVAEKIIDLTKVAGETTCVDCQVLKLPDGKTNAYICDWNEEQGRCGLAAILAIAHEYA